MIRGDVEGVRERVAWLWGNDGPSSRSSECKGPEADAFPRCSSDRGREASPLHLGGRNPSPESLWGESDPGVPDSPSLRAPLSFSSFILCYSLHNIKLAVGCLKVYSSVVFSLFTTGAPAASGQCRDTPCTLEGSPVPRKVAPQPPLPRSGHHTAPTPRDAPPLGASCKCS